MHPTSLRLILDLVLALVSGGGPDKLSALRPVVPNKALSLSLSLSPCRLLNSRGGLKFGTILRKTQFLRYLTYSVPGDLKNKQPTERVNNERLAERETLLYRLGSN